MAARTKSTTSGGAGITVFGKIDLTTNAVKTVAVDLFFFDQQRKTTIGGGIARGTSGQKVVLDSDKNSEALDTWLKANQVDEPDAAEEYYYESGVKYTGSLSTALTDVFVTIGPLKGGKRQLAVGVAVVSAGDYDYEHNKSAIRQITATTQAWNGAAPLTFPAGFWDLIVADDGTTKLLDSTDPLLTGFTIPVGKASGVVWADGVV